MTSLAVIPVAIGVLRAELLGMAQKRDEPFRAFVSRVRGRAETCNFVTKSECSCGITNMVDYTEKMMLDVLLAGVYDTDIRRDILGIDGITEKSVNEVTALVEKQEMARDANSVSGSTSSISRKQEVKNSSSGKSPHVRESPPGFHEPSAADREKTAQCLQCGENFFCFFSGT